MPHFAVTAIGRDRPGIVAAISEALLGVEGNIEDSRMAILRGHFAVMLIVSTPNGVDRDGLAADLRPAADALELEALAVNEVDEISARAPAPSHVLTVYGADHPGIVHAVSSVLAGLGVNITDLSTQLAGDPARPIYLLVMELALGDAEAEAVTDALSRVGEEAAVEVSLRELDAEPL